MIVGEDQAAHWYERHLRKLAESLDYRYESEQLYGDAKLDDVLATIGKLNADPRVSGILVLRPLPVHVPEHEAFAAVDPRKDVEGMHPWNIGLLAIGTPRFVPSTPAACFYLLDAYARSRDEEPSSFYRGKTLVIVGQIHERRQAPRVPRPATRRDRGDVSQQDVRSRRARRLHAARPYPDRCSR